MGYKRKVKLNKDEKLIVKNVGISKICNIINEKKVNYGNGGYGTILSGGECELEIPHYAEATIKSYAKLFNKLVKINNRGKK